MQTPTSCWSLLLSIPLLWSVLLVRSARSASCANIMGFSACNTAAAMEIAKCNNLVKDVPTYDYWNCLCQKNQNIERCYDQCPEDEILQLQRSTLKADNTGTCAYVEQLKAAGKSAPKTATTTRRSKTSSGTSTATGTTLPSPVVLPKPEGFDGGSTSSVVFDNGTNTGAFPTLSALFVGMFLLILAATV